MHFPNPHTWEAEEKELQFTTSFHVMVSDRAQQQQNKLNAKAGGWQVQSQPAFRGERQASLSYLLRPLSQKDRKPNKQTKKNQ